MAEELPENSLVLQALHAIRASIDQTNQRLDQTNQRLDKLTTEVHAGLAETNQRIDDLRKFTVQKLTDLNTKADETNARLGRLEDRFENFLSGQGAQLVQRVAKVEAELDLIKAKLHT